MEIFTIGYANKPIELFIKCLKDNGITCLIDVRTMPFSGAFLMYDKPLLKETLKNEGILYAHFGDEFGARREENEAYSIRRTLRGEAKNQVDFDKVYKLPLFKKGVERVKKAINQGYKICFMCSEKHPIDCHRFWMVAYYFKMFEDGFDVINIVSENEKETFEEVIQKVELEKEAKKFFKEHDELDSFSLIEMETPKWIEWWGEFFRNNASLEDKTHIFSNIRIGYVKGEEENE